MVTGKTFLCTFNVGPDERQRRFGRFLGFGRLTTASPCSAEATTPAVDLSIDLGERVYKARTFYYSTSQEPVVVSAVRASVPRRCGDDSILSVRTF